MRYAHKQMVNNPLQDTTADACPWLDDVRTALAALPRDVSQRDIAIATGIPESWLSKFMADKYDSPKIHYIYRLAKYLKTKHV